MGNTMADQTASKAKGRRNGMANIFDGIDPAVLEKLGLSDEMVSELNRAEADDTLSMCVSQIAEAVKSAGSMEKSRVHRSFSTTVSEEMKQALQNRRRRNAVGNLLELLSTSQQILLVEHLQDQLERLAIKRVNGEVDSEDNEVIPKDDAVLDSSLQTTPSTCSANRGPALPQGQIVCH